MITTDEAKYSVEQRDLFKKWKRVSFGFHTVEAYDDLKRYFVSNDKRPLAVGDGWKTTAYLFFEGNKFATERLLVVGLTPSGRASKPQLFFEKEFNYSPKSSRVNLGKSLPFFGQEVDGLLGLAETEEALDFLGDLVRDDRLLLKYLITEQKKTSGVERMKLFQKFGLVPGVHIYDAADLVFAKLLGRRPSPIAKLP